ncbi:MAG: hypothetical protein IKZ96_01875 [Bacilli bacterium]|nr:hypothetical protein [Bacilli bacterium]
MKKYNLFKILGIVILFTVIISYFVPGTIISYGEVSKDTIMPVALTDTFFNGLTSLSVFITTIVYILTVGFFYAILDKTEKYDGLVTSVARRFSKRKTLFIALVVFILGILSAVTGQIYVALFILPFFISVIRKLGYGRGAAIAATIGATIIGNAGSLHTYYNNQILNLTVTDNLLYKIVLTLVLLLALLAFILVFNKKPEKVDLSKENVSKTLPLKIIMGILLVLVVLGFVPWGEYFGFDGFSKFLETLQSAKVANVSIFNSIVGNEIVEFGAFELHNLALLLFVVTIVIAIIYRVKFNEVINAFGIAFRKSIPYIVILLLAGIVFINLYTSGVYYTFVTAFSEKINLFTSSVISGVTGLFYPDYTYASQFALSGVSYTTSSTGYEAALAIIFQAIYSLVLLISPTSILVFFGLRYTDVSYKDWMKYIWKFFLIVLLVALVILSIATKGFGLFAIIVSIIIIGLVILALLDHNKKLIKEVKKEAKEEAKESKKSKK